MTKRTLPTKQLIAAIIAATAISLPAIASAQDADQQIQGQITSINGTWNLTVNDGDGYTDIFVANDVSNQFLFHNNGNGTFTETAFDSGAALTNDGKMLSGMGVAFQDYDNDGLPDLLVTQLPHAPYVVFHNEGKGLFNAAELETGFGALSGAELTLRELRNAHSGDVTVDLDPLVFFGETHLAHERSPYDLK